MYTNDALREATGLTLRQFIIKGATDFKFWTESLFRIKLKPFHLEWVKMFYNNKRSCVIAARQHGKSTVLGALFHLWMVFYEKNKNFMIVSPNMSLSTKHIADMRGFINEIELLQTLKPADRGRSWTKTEINTSTNCKIFCKPYSDNMRGYEALHYCLLDEASYLEDLTIYERAILPMVSFHDGNLMAIGTVRTETDLLAQAQLPGSDFVVKKYPAIVNDKPLWPEKFSMEKLMRFKRNQGPLAFAREYLLELRGEAEQAIPSELILKAMDTNLKLKNLGEDGKEYYIGADLAMSPGGDWSVFTVVEKTKGNIIVKHAESYRGMDFPSQAKILAGIYQRFHPRTLLIDESLFGNALIDILRREYYISAKGFKFLPQNRNVILGELSNLFREGRITIPRNLDCANTKSYTNVLINQLSGLYPAKTKEGLDTYRTTTKHDDHLISLALACHAALQMKTGEVYIKVI